MLQLARDEALAPAGGEFAEACMAAAAARAGLSLTPVDERLAEVTPDETLSPELQKLLETGDSLALSDALANALDENRAATALALVEALGRIDDASVLYTADAQPSPLAAALVFPDRRVRFAAVEAIRSLDPRSPFPGSSQLPKTLRYLATAHGERRAVVLMPVAEHATTLAGRLAGMGFVAEPATRGGPAMRMAQRSADLEMIFVDYSIHSPAIRDMLYALRTNPATGRIPIALLATSDRLLDAKLLSTEHTRVIVFPRPQSDEWLAHIVDELNELSAGDGVSPDERATIGRQARGWIESQTELRPTP
jgi:CheY-like chemotaxis protein